MTKIMTMNGGGYVGNENPITKEEEVVLLPIGVLSVQKSEDDLQLYGGIPILMPGPYNTTINPKSNGI